MVNYTRAEFVVLFVMLVLNVFAIVFVLGTGELTGLAIFNGEEKNSPQDFIHDEDITFEGNKIIIEVQNPVLSHYENTGSMEPVLGGSSTGIGFKPATPQEIIVGDIISFRKDKDLVVHRVVEKGEDEKGVYFVTKGDNNNFDDGKVRFEEINSVLVGVLY